MPRSDSAAPKASSDLDTVLATPLLDVLDLPPRVASFAWEEGLETIGDLARIPPSALLEERNLGRTSIGATRRILENMTGVAWEDIANPKQGSEPPPAPEPGSWDAVRWRMNDIQRLVPLVELDLPFGLRRLLERRGVFTLGDLAQWSTRDLLELPGVGRRTLVKLPVRVEARLAALVAEHTDGPLFGAFLRAVDDLETKRRYIVRARCGLEGAPMSLAESARTLGVTPERARQLEERAAVALRERAWARVAEHNVNVVLREGPVPFAFLFDDPWWSTAADRPPLVAFIVERVLDDFAHVVQLDGAHWLSRASRADLEETWMSLARASESLVELATDREDEELFTIAIERLGPCRHLIDRFRARVLGR